MKSFPMLGRTPSAFDHKVQEILTQQGDQLVQQYWEMLEKEIGKDEGGDPPPQGLG